MEWWKKVKVEQNKKEDEMGNDGWNKKEITIFLS